MRFEQLNPGYCWSFLFGAGGGREVAIVDPVLEQVPDYLALLEREGPRLTHVVDTHTHADHISGGAALKDLTGCEYVMHTRAPVRCATLRVGDDYRAELAGVPVRILHTPGHTQDSLTLVLPDRLLTGDTLFLDDGGAGRDDLPGGNPEQHWESLQRLLTLPDDLVVYPAHEYRHRQPSTLGEQRRRNPHLQPRTREEYVRYVEELKLGPAEWMKAVLQANYACARDPRAAWVPVDVPACEVKGTLAAGVNDQQVTTISPAELKARLEAGEPLLLLDVREPAELTGAEGHLAGARNVPIGALSERLGELGAPDQAIVTVCRSGGRVSTAAQILQQAGYRNVRVLEGGMVAWRMAGYPVAVEA